MGMRPFLSVASLAVLIAAAAAAQQPEQASIDRGRYLTHDVAMCVQCHSPRRQNGTIIADRVFRGGVVPVFAPPWISSWAEAPPDLVSLANTDPARIVSVLRTGQRPDGSAPRPPMPPFRLSEEDAFAVVNYLRSLSTASKP